jgi:hypothetical protein
MNKRTQIVKVTLARLKRSNITGRSENQKYFPAMSKSHLHNYFADKMSVFSVIIGYIFEKAKQTQPEVSGPFNSLYARLVKMRFDFLYKYHQLSFSSREVIKDESERIKVLFEHIYQFDRTVVSEILRTGIHQEELQKLNKRSSLLLSRR